MSYFSTGKYNLKTDKFEGGGVACFVRAPSSHPSLPSVVRVIEAKTLEELAHKVKALKP